MEKQKDEQLKEHVSEETLSAAVGGVAGRGSGYCPYTPDRTCKTDKGGWSDSEICKECGWRAW